MSVTFVPVTEAHRPLLQNWLAQPHMQEWWGEPEEELRLIYAVEDGEHQPFIACINGAPMAYIQAWWPSQHPDLPWQHGMDRTTRGIDITIGDAGDLGKGYGPLIIKHFAAKLFAEGATRLVIDPDARNMRAINAYLKSGFTPFAEHREANGETSVLMEMLSEDHEWLHDV